MNTETTIKPQPKLILPFLAWNFGWTWGFWLLDIILKNLWPDSPPTAYLALEAILNGIAMFGPMLASLIVLKKKGFKAICSYLFSGKKETWLYLLIYGGGLTAFYALASGGKLVDGALVSFPWFSNSIKSRRTVISETFMVSMISATVTVPARATNLRISSCL